MLREQGQNSRAGIYFLEHSQGKYAKVLYNMRQGSGLGEIENGFAHAPPRQEFGDALTRSMRNSTQNRDGKLIYLLVYCFSCLCLRAWMYISDSINEWVTDPRV